MKKITILVLALVLALSLCACGRRNNSTRETMPSTDFTVLPDPTLDTNIPDPNVDTQMPMYTEGTNNTEDFTMGTETTQAKP